MIFLGCTVNQCTGITNIITTVNYLALFHPIISPMCVTSWIWMGINWRGDSRWWLAVLEICTSITSTSRKSCFQLVSISLVRIRASCAKPHHLGVFEGESLQYSHWILASWLDPAQESSLYVYSLPRKLGRLYKDCRNWTLLLITD